MKGAEHFNKVFHSGSSVLNITHKVSLPTHSLAVVKYPVNLSDTVNHHILA